MNKNMKILVVDDFKSMRSVVMALLRELGFHNLDEAPDGQVAFAKLQAGDFDFLVTDWNMPRMSGIDLVRAVRGDPRLTKMPILMITAEAKREQVLEAAQAGMSGYVLKPFSAVTLEEKIHKILRRTGAG